MIPRFAIAALEEFIDVRHMNPRPFAMCSRQ
jgi:hypothetical protein